jgi:hypothetical protein
MNAYPFSVFKRTDRSCFSVSFKDANGKYMRPIFSGKRTEIEAAEIAFKWLRDRIPQDKTELSVYHLLIEAVKRIRVWQSKAGFCGFFMGFIGM